MSGVFVQGQKVKAMYHQGRIVKAAYVGGVQVFPDAEPVWFDVPAQSDYSLNINDYDDSSKRVFTIDEQGFHFTPPDPVHRANTVRDVIFRYPQTGVVKRYDDVDAMLNTLESIQSPGWYLLTFAPDGTPWALNSKGKVARKPPTGWVLDSSLASIRSYSWNSLTVAPDGTQWALNNRGLVARKTSEGWVLDSSLESIQLYGWYSLTFAPDGTQWVLNYSGLVARKTSEGWVLDSSLKSIQLHGWYSLAFAPDGTQWVLNYSGYVVRKTSEGWVLDQDSVLFGIEPNKPLDVRIGFRKPSDPPTPALTTALPRPGSDTTAPGL